MLRNIFKQNLDGTWKEYINFVKPSSGTSAYLINHEPSNENIEDIKHGSLILIIRNPDQTYTIAYADKDGDYQKRSMKIRSIIQQLNHCSPSSVSCLENNSRASILVPKINDWLEERDSKSKIHQYLPNLDVTGVSYFATFVVGVIGFIAIPFIVAAKSLFDWVTRKSMTKDKVLRLADTITAMGDHEFVRLSNKITQTYQKTCTTSNSSRKIIKQFRGQNQDANIPQNIKQDKTDLVDYMRDHQNNGKKLFCTVANLVEVSEYENLKPAF